MTQADTSKTSSAEECEGRGHHRLSSPTKKLTFSLFFAIQGCVLLADQLTKAFVRFNITPGARFPVIPGAFDFTLIYNEGAAFGIGEGKQIIFICTALLFVGFILLYLAKRHRRTYFDVVALSLVAAGAIGNLLDRLFFSGSVTDFIELLFIRFPIFNLADMCVCIGSVLFVIAFVVLPDREEPMDEDKTDCEDDAGNMTSS